MYGYIYKIYITVAILTAAMEMLVGGHDAAAKVSRKPEIMSDAAYAILTKNSSSFTGNFAVDEDLLRAEGVTDFDNYAVDPSNYTKINPH